jgi:hypothetical protein
MTLVVRPACPRSEPALLQLGHSNLGITSDALTGRDDAQIIKTAHARRAAMAPLGTTPQP